MMTPSMVATMEVKRYRIPVRKPTEPAFSNLTIPYRQPHDGGDLARNYYSATKEQHNEGATAVL